LKKVETLKDKLYKMKIKNDHDLVRGLPKQNYDKDQVCSALVKG